MATKGAVYKSTDTGNVFECVDVPGFDATGHPDDQEIGVRRLSDGEWYTVFQDTFRSHFTKVADSRDGYNESE